MHALYLCVVVLLEIMGDVSQSAGAFVVSSVYVVTFFYFFC